MNKNISGVNYENSEHEGQTGVSSPSTNGMSKKMYVAQDHPESTDQFFPKNDEIHNPKKGFRRYENSLRNLIPIRRMKRRKEPASIDNVGLLSVIFFSWISKVMYKCYRGGLPVDELPALSPYDAGIRNAKRLELLWKEEMAKRKPEEASFARVVWKFCRTRVLASCLVITLSLISSLLTHTLFMRKLLECVQSGNESYAESAKWALLLVASELSRAIFLSWSMALNFRTALRLRTACLTLLYRKIIRVDNLGNKNIGKTINMFTNDAQRIHDVIVYGPLIVAAPISTAFGIFYVVQLLGYMALIGMLALLLFFLGQYMVSRLAVYLQSKAVTISDMRVRMMNEILDCIKLIKMYAWDKYFGNNLIDVRRRERQVLRKTLYCQIFCDTVLPAMSIVCGSITFLSHLAVGNNLTTAQAFPFMTLLDAALYSSLCFFQESVEAMVSASVSFGRLKELLLLEEGNCSTTKPVLEDRAVAISNGTFGYQTCDDHNDGSSLSKSGEETEAEKLNKPTLNVDRVDVLFDVSLEAKKGGLIGICGQVGSGKSSLLLAALGQLRVSEGQVARDGSCAYVSQEAWITNATLRENILFGAEYDQGRYRKTIHACNLSQDIGTMPGGDGTEIGERGVNLSGGQKQRVALARALYADRDIYFLDDPLSAVDSRVGSYIFDNLILGALKEKTVLFVTHQIQYLNRCDYIYMMRDGRIVEHGSHDELIKLGNEYASMVTAVSEKKDAEDVKTEDREIKALSRSMDDYQIPEKHRSRAASIISYISDGNEPFNINDAQLTVADDLAQGAVKARTYHSYIAAAGGYFAAFLAFMVFVVVNVTHAFNPWWLAKWIDAGEGNTTMKRDNGTILPDIKNNPDFHYYQTIYGASVGVLLVTCVFRSLVYTEFTIRAASKIHNGLFKKIIDAPMRFFDTTPTGRIQHLFSRDMDEIDNKLTLTLSRFIQTMVAILVAVMVICMVFPWFVIPMCIFAAILYFSSKIFRVAIRDLKRLENKARAPVISIVTATVQGLSTIHAFGKEDYFIARFSKLFDENSNCLFTYNVATRWLVTRIDTFSVAVIGIAAASIILLQNQVPATLAGLALTYSIQVSVLLQFTVLTLTETEIRFISLERINRYMRMLKREGSESQSTVEPSSTWPSAAEIKFNNVSMAYGEGAPLILKDVSFSIGAGEKIGIVGRTGSGKSSLTVALFRLVELAEGKISIDDVDISAISLDQLRTKLSIIPQDPVLFSGTIRSNLDPSKLYTDAQVWQALEKTELKSRVQSLSGHLDASVGFGGDTLSVGERQLLCLARALLRNSKILVLDEATAAVDRETEIAIQKTILQEFSRCTILTIAHRLQTVLSLDKILVMNDGRVLEFDTPSNLLDNKSSEFSKMIAAAGKAECQ